MPRVHNIDGVAVPFTPEEEIARDAEEATWETEKPARAMDTLRVDRDALLVSNDWTQATDSPLTGGVKASWVTYRQQLRDLPANTADPANPTWPTAPE